MLSNVARCLVHPYVPAIVCLLPGISSNNCHKNKDEACGQTYLGSSIWSERNGVVFKERKVDADEIFHLAQTETQA